MSVVSLVELGDLTAAYRLYGVCNACSRMDKLSVVALATRLGPRHPIARIRDKLRCRRCHSRDCGIRIVWVGRTGFGYA